MRKQLILSLVLSSVMGLVLLWPPAQARAELTPKQAVDLAKFLGVLSDKIEYQRSLLTPGAAPRKTHSGFMLQPAEVQVALESALIAGTDEDREQAALLIRTLKRLDSDTMAYRINPVEKRVVTEADLEILSELFESMLNSEESLRAKPGTVQPKPVEEFLLTGADRTRLYETFAGHTPKSAAEWKFSPPKATDQSLAERPETAGRNKISTPCTKPNCLSGRLQVHKSDVFSYLSSGKMNSERAESNYTKRPAPNPARASGREEPAMAWADLDRQYAAALKQISELQSYFLRGNLREFWVQ